MTSAGCSTLAAMAQTAGLPLVASNAPLYATPAQRRLHDVLTCIAEKTTLAEAGQRLAANAERHLKSPAEMARLFAGYPRALTETTRILNAVTFSLDQLRYEYPQRAGAARPQPARLARNPDHDQGPRALARRHSRHRCRRSSTEEFRIIAKAGYAPYFLTVHDIVSFAQGRGILCQGRGSAANSAVCFVLGITAVDPAKHNLLFSRFISEERREPPDIDVDFEHERREEVMQYIYARYGRERAGIAATVIHYRGRSAVREVGKVLGLSEDVTARLTGTVWGSFATHLEKQRFAECGFDPEAPDIARLGDLVDADPQIPPPSVAACRRLRADRRPARRDRARSTMPPCPTAPSSNGTRTISTRSGLMKVDVLALGMLTAIRKAFTMLETHIGRQMTLDNVPDEDAGGLRHAVPGRQHRRLPGRKPGADEHAAAPASARLLRSRHPGRHRPPRPDPGRHGPPLSAPPAGAREGRFPLPGAAARSR